MQTGFFIHHFKNPGGPQNLGQELAAVARTAEQAGFDSLWVLDHLFQMEPAGIPADDPMLEAYTTLAYLAGHTEKITLGTMVTGVIYRQPGMLAKIVTTLDVLSGGRAWLGIGAGWYEREARGLGIPFPSTRERFEWLEETLRIVRQMWSDNDGPFEGTHFKLAETLNSPQPLQQPYPRLLVGGMGEKKTLRLVAKYADASNFGGEADLDTVRHKLNVLHGHCEAVGRDYDSLTKTVVRNVGGRDPADVVDECGTLSQLGVRHVMFILDEMYDVGAIEAFAAEVLPEVRRL